MILNYHFTNLNAVILNHALGHDLHALQHLGRREKEMEGFEGIVHFSVFKLISPWKV